MTFKDQFHEEFFNKNKTEDEKYNSFIYLIGVLEENRTNLDKIINIKTKEIKPSIINASWLEEDNKKILRAAFNLYLDKYPTVDYTEDKETEKLNYCISSIFNTELAPYIYQAAMIKYSFIKDNTRKAGRKNKFNKDDFEKMQELRDEGYTYQEIAEEFNTSKVTILKTFKRETE